jgi:hypothetical protein
MERKVPKYEKHKIIIIIIKQVWAQKPMAYNLTACFISRER